MAETLLIDTDVLIDFLREQADAVAYLEGLTEPILMSVIAMAELYSDVREGNERNDLDIFISLFELLPIDEEIATKGGFFAGIIARATTSGSPTRRSLQPPRSGRPPW